MPVMVRLWLGLALLLSLAAAAEAAPYAGVEFTELFTDLADNAGLVDITAAAVGEPGGDTFVIKVSVADFGVSTPADNVHLFMTIADQAYAPGFDSTATPGTFTSATDANAFKDATPERCEVDGNDVYCEILYSKVGATVGGTLSNNYGVSYRQLAQDYAPGAGGYVPANFIGETGADYTFTGCTKEGGCAAAVASGPRIIHNNLTGPAASVKLAFSATTNDTYLYNWTAPIGDLQLVSNLTVAAGSVSIKVTDAKGAVVFEQAAASGNKSLAVKSTGGAWRIAITFKAFRGGIDLSIGGAPTTTTTTSTGPGQVGGESTTGAAGNQTASGDTSSTSAPEEDTPGFGLAASFVAVTAATALVRRRLAK